MILFVDTKVDVQYRNGGISMEKIPNAVYTRELREEAVKMITEGGMKASEVARILSIPKSTITYCLNLPPLSRQKLAIFKFGVLISSRHIHTLC